eukprot:1708335-Rhodomonas_salina.1
MATPEPPIRTMEAPTGRSRTDAERSYLCKSFQRAESGSEETGRQAVTLAAPQDAASSRNLGTRDEGG